jgi:hypothetical protein
MHTGMGVLTLAECFDDKGEAGLGSQIPFLFSPGWCIEVLKRKTGGEYHASACMCGSKIDIVVLDYSSVFERKNLFRLLFLGGEVWVIP